MTLLELLIAMSIMVIVVGSLAFLAEGVQQGFLYTEGCGLATQHARVVLERIGATIREATANEQFPGAIVVAESADGERFPDTLVVWHPGGAAADPDGLPRFNELLIYCPRLSQPNELVEITVPGDTRTVPAVDDQAQWAAEISAIKASDSSDVVTLTRLVRTCSATGSIATSWRGAVRFEARIRPSQSQWDAYQDGDLEWDELAWVQGYYGSQTGLRQTWVRSELQLLPDEAAVAAENVGGNGIPFFGSAALYYEMHK
jgi:Tfp pilus assembly protein PilW